MSDGSSTTLTRFPPSGNGRGVVLVLPAMGVRADYYAKVGAALAERGFTAVIVDLRGNGGSSVRPSRRLTFGYAELLELELPEITRAVCRDHEVDQVAVLGHSLGGQLAAMFAATAPYVSHTVLVASGSAWYRRVPGLRAAGRFLGLQVMFGTTALLGYLPGWLPFAGKEARGVMRDWGREAMTGTYRVSGSAVDYEQALAESTVPALFLTFPGDRYVPEGCSQHLAAKLRSAEVTHQAMAPDLLGLVQTHHFRWAHKPWAVVDAAVAWFDASNTDAR